MKMKIGYCFDEDIVNILALKDIKLKTLRCIGCKMKFKSYQDIRAVYFKDDKPIPVCNEFHCQIKARNAIL